jgi:hypothetical protein
MSELIKCSTYDGLFSQTTIPTHFSLDLTRLTQKDIKNIKTFIEEHPDEKVSYGYTTFKSQGRCPIQLSYNPPCCQLSGSVPYDVIIPEYIIIPFGDNNYECYIEMEDTILVMQINEWIVAKYPLSLLIRMGGLKSNNFKYCIDLKNNMLFNDITMCNLANSKVQFSLQNMHGDGLYISNYEIVCRTILIDYTVFIREGPHKQFLNEPQIRLIQQLSSPYSITEQTQEVVFNKFGTGLTKGIFIECSNINHLENIKVFIWHHLRFDLDYFLILNKCKIIGNALYVPFNDFKHDEISYESKIGCIPFEMIDYAKLVLTFSKPVSYVKIYCLMMNGYVMKNGIMGPICSYDG